MAKIFTLIAIALLALIPSGGSSTSVAKNAQKEVQEVKQESTLDWVNSTLVPATAELYVRYDSGEYDDVCTAHAFQRTQNGYLFVSVAHCFTGYFYGKQLPVPLKFFINKRNPDHPRYDAVVRTWVGSPLNGFDVAIFEVVTDETYTIVPLGDDSTKFLDSIVNVSDPEGHGIIANLGWVERPSNNRDDVNKFNGMNWVGYTIVKLPGTSPGSSGSAVVCIQQRAVCGLIVGRKDEQWYALPVSRVVKFYNQVVIANLAGSH